MDERPLFQGMDEQERLYAPEQLPPDDPEQAVVRADEGYGAANDPSIHEPPAAAPVANLGNAPSAAAAPPNIGNVDRGGAPGAPNTEADYPMNSDDQVDRDL